MVESDTFCGGFQPWRALFRVKDDAEALFEKMPRDIKRLNKQARKERRLKERLKWKRENIQTPSMPE